MSTISRRVFETSYFFEVLIRSSRPSQIGCKFTPRNFRKTIFFCIELGLLQSSKRSRQLVSRSATDSTAVFFIRMSPRPSVGYNSRGDHPIKRCLSDTQSFNDLL